MKCLGLPLTTKKPRKIDMQPMINAVQNRMEGWKSNILSYGGRVTLVKAVMTTMHLHYMQPLNVPKRVLKHLDKMRRDFLWKGNKMCRGINCLVNWETVCALTQNGGMGIIDLAVQNEALLIKWLWRLDSTPASQWAQTVQKIYGTGDAIWESTNKSFFIKDIERNQNFYQISTEPEPLNGAKRWRWTQEGKYTCATAYIIMHNRGTTCPYYKALWKLKIPTKVTIFVWLVTKNSLLTQEVLIIRGCNVPHGCVFCDSTAAEHASTCSGHALMQGPSGEA